MLRWRIALMIGVAIAISYLDRQTLPVAIDAIRKTIPVSNGRFADLNVAFLVTYALMYAGGGKLLDALGTRRGFTLIMVFWSLACASHGLAMGFAMLVASRLLLGVGEGGGFPAATRAMTEWFPVEERSVAMGIMNGGTAIGGIAAPPLIALILHHYQLSWRWVFFFTGTLGILWTIWWRLEFYLPENHPRISAAEREMLAQSNRADVSGEPAPRWRDLLAYQQTWGLVIAKFLSDAAWYFYLLWLPKYLYDVRGFDVSKVGKFAWIPHAAAGAGCLLGGWLSSWLLRKKLPVNLSRKIALGASAVIMPAVFFIPHARDAWMIVLFSIAYFGQQSWSTLVMTVPGDLFPRCAVGAAAGLVGFGGAMGGVCFLKLAGFLLDHHYGYTPLFAMAGSLHLMAFVVVLCLIPKIQQVSQRNRSDLETVR